ncbi:MAG: hypothetical protein IJQ90_04240 [Alphaproteobacteria bacterium]|nr:hypothetical protein [Alphaproteobacteria bacterium]
MQSEADKYLEKLHKESLIFCLEKFFDKHPKYKFTFSELSLIFGLLSRQFYVRNHKLFSNNNHQKL